MPFLWIKNLLIFLYKSTFRCEDVIATLSYQFTANSPQEAVEWVDQIKIVLRGKQEFLSTVSQAPFVLQFYRFKDVGFHTFRFVKPSETD